VAISIRQPLLEMDIVRVIDHGIYPRKAIGEARAAYKDYCAVRVEPLPSDSACLTISVLPKHAPESREVVLSFLNYALDKSAEIHLQGD
jgi:hypothetical protein